MIVIADTTPINHLVVPHTADLLEKLYGCVMIPVSIENRQSEIRHSLGSAQPGRWPHCEE